MVWIEGRKRTCASKFSPALLQVWGRFPAPLGQSRTGQPTSAHTHSHKINPQVLFIAAEILPGQCGGPLAVTWFSMELLQCNLKLFIELCKQGNLASLNISVKKKKKTYLYIYIYFVFANQHIRGGTRASSDRHWGKRRDQSQPDLQLHQEQDVQEDQGEKTFSFMSTRKEI